MYDIPSPKIPFFKFLFVVIISPHDEGPGGMYMYIDLCKGSLPLKGRGCPLVYLFIKIFQINISTYTN